MKKTLLLFAMLLGVVGAWAEEDNFVTPEAGKYYIIKGDHATYHWLTGVVESGGIDVSDNREDAGIYYYDGTSLRIKDTQTYIGKNNNKQISLVGSKTNVTITPSGNAGKCIINVGGHNLYNNQPDFTREAENLTADPGNNRYTWGFIEVENAYDVFEGTLNLTATNFANSSGSIWTYNQLATATNSAWYGKLYTKTTPCITMATYNKTDGQGVSRLGWASDRPWIQPGVICNIDAPAGYVITSYSMTTIGYNFTGTFTYTTAEGTATSEAQVHNTEKTVSAEGLETNRIQIIMDGNVDGGKGIFVKTLNITYKYSPVVCNLTDDAGNEYTGTTVRTKVNGVDEPAISGVEGYTLVDGIWANNVYTGKIKFPVAVSKADATADIPVIISSYTNLDAGAYRYYVDGINVKARPSAEPTADNLKWVIYPQFENGAFSFKIKNVATQKYIKANATSVLHNEGTITVDDNATIFTIAEENRFKLPIANKAQELFLSVGSSTSSNYNQHLGVYTWIGSQGGDHKGLCNYVYPSDLPYVITDNYGNVYKETVDATTGNPNNFTITGVPSNFLSAFTFDALQYNATVTFPFPVSSETAINPTLMSSWDENKKWHSMKNDDGTYYVKIYNDTPDLGTWQWLIYPSFNNGAFSFKIKNVGTGLYVHAKPELSGDHAKGGGQPVVLTNDATNFTIVDRSGNINFQYKNNNEGNMYLTVNGTGSNNCPLGVINVSHQGNDVKFPTFNQYKITIGSTGYTTVYSPFTAFTYSEDLKIYTITSAPQDGRVNLNLITSPQAADVSNYIYENQGVIIKGTPGTTYTFNLTDWEDYYDAKAWENNELLGSITNTYVKGDAYVLANGTNGVGLYKALLNKDANGESGDTHFKNNAGKAYLPVTNGAGARFLVFSFGDDMETGITETENGNVKTENDEVYDLSGRRVQGAQKGIFIVNGKKVVR